MTTNHLVPTPPPTEPAPSLRPVEELQALCDAAPQSGPWRYQLFNGVDRVICEADAPDVLVAEFDLDTDAMLAAGAVNALPSLLARLRAAEETLAAVGALHRPDTEEHHQLFRDGSGCIWCDDGGEESRPLLRLEKFEGRVVHVHGIAPVDQVCIEDEQEWPCPTAAALAEGASR